MDVLATRPERWSGLDAAAARLTPSTTAAAPVPPSRRRFAFLTADGQAATPLEQEALLGSNDLLEASFLDRCMLVRECVGRVRFQTPDGRGFATGFLVAPGVLLTNHHVFPTAAAARGAAIEFGYRYDIAGQLPLRTDEHDLAPDAFFVADETLDFAAVAVAERSTLGSSIADRGFLRLIPETGKAGFGEYVTILQHPDGAAMQVALRENRIVRLEEDEPFLWYKADTAHGSSGAAVFNDSLQLVALHASGHIRRDAQGRYALADGQFADSLDGVGESDVLWDANVGFRISRIAPALIAAARARAPEIAARLEAATRGGDVLSAAVARSNDTATATATARTQPREQDMTEPTAPPPAAEAQAGVRSAAPGGALIVPLHLRISLELGTADVAAALVPAPSAANLAAEAFRLRIPVIYDGLDERAGFQPDYLELGTGNAPAPVLTDAGKALAAPLLDGSGSELRYQHFSLWMHRQRRLALFTASNVDWRARRKTVEGKSTSRKSLAGFPDGSSFAEQWVTDPRIDARHQLPDVFYNEDRGGFDKGHIVRRDDVCWGETFKDIQMANGDTFHVTNCSPQTKAFNEGQAGEENWGDFETFVQQATARDNEKAILYAGPIFGADDRWFNGTDEAGPTRVQIPNRFWKIVVVKGDAGAEAFGFVLSQDVGPITEAEFYVTAEWTGAMMRIADIQDLLRGWIALDALVAIDRFDQVSR